MSLQAVLKRATHPAVIGKTTHRFLQTLDKMLPEQPTQEEYQAAVDQALKNRRFRDLSSGLRALADAAWVEKGPSGIKCYLQVEAEIAHDADARDSWNRDVRKNLGPILKTVVREGRKELTTADTVQAFALEHGLPLLETTIRERYEAPKVEDRQSWAKEVVEALQGDLAKWPKWEVKIDLSKVQQLADNLSGKLDEWMNLQPAAQQKLWARIQECVAEYKDQPLNALYDLLKGMWATLDRVPTEVHLVVSTAISLAIAAKIAVDVTSLPGALFVMVGLLTGWFLADLGGAHFHHKNDNYPDGRLGREFVDHHYNPKAVSEWPLIRNIGGLIAPTTPVLAAAAQFLPGGTLGTTAAAFALTFLNGLIYTQHIHGYSHASPDDVPAPIRWMQKAWLLLPPSMHRVHHGRPLGKDAYGVLNGWSNWLCDVTGYWRGVEAVVEHATGREPTWRHEAEVRKVAMQRKKEGIRGTSDCT